MLSGYELTSPTVTTFMKEWKLIPEAPQNG